MKRYLIILLITLFSGVSYAEDLQNSPIINPSDVIFRSSLTDIVQDLNETHDEYSELNQYQKIDPYNMPLFQQIRLKLTNKYYERVNKNEENRKNKAKSQKPSFWQKFIKQDELDEQDFDYENENDITDAIETETNMLSEGELSLESGINKEVTEKQLTLDAENINFDDETGEMVALGRPKLYFPQQDTTVVADKMTYDDDGNILKAFGNVTILKDQIPLNSDYLEIDMNEESMQMDNMAAVANNMTINAKKAVQEDGLVILTNGNLHSDRNSISRIASRMVGPRFEDMIISPGAEALFFGNPEGNKLKIHIDNLEIEGRKNHDIIRAKNIKIYHKDKYLFKWPRLTAYTNKERSYFEGNYPEFGSRRKLGMFVGPGFVFGGPNGSVIKIIPFINYKKDFGFGGMLKYVNTYNHTELGYGSSNDIFFLRGNQRLDKNLFLHYAANSYTDEWFLGGRMAKYMVEAYYQDTHNLPNFLAKGMDLRFSQRAGFGLMQDDDKNYNGEKFGNPNDMSTTRTRYMAELRQTLYNYRNETNRVFVETSVAMQGSAALYGTGDTQFIARFGPRIRFQYKNWMQDVEYFIAGYDDKTPMPRYDSYRYGRQSVHLTEAFRLTKYLSVGWSGYFNLSDDAQNGKLFQENAFIVSLGPDDFKILLGYDFVRQRTYFAFNVAFDPKGTNIEYDRMVIKNPERVGQHEGDENEHQIAFTPSPTTTSAQSERKLFNKQNEKAPVLQYAQVIEIEDPDKERID